MLGLELLMASHLLFQQVSTASPIQCPVQKSARVDVRWRSEPVKYDVSKSHAELGQGQIDSDNPYGAGVATDVGGLMTGKIKYKSGIEVSTLQFPSAKVTCLWIEKVVVDLIIDPTIQIAAEKVPGSCEYNAILEHEQKHVTTDRQVVKDHVERIRVATGQAVQKVGVVGPKPNSTIEGFKGKMSDYVQEALKTSIEAMYKDRVARQQALDTKEEYDRVDDLCEK